MSRFVLEAATSGDALIEHLVVDLLLKAAVVLVALALLAAGIVVIRRHLGR